MAATLNLKFTNATAQDAERIQHLIQTAFQTEDSRQDWTGIVELASNFKLDLNEVKDKLNNPDITTLLAFDENNDNLVGTIEVSQRVGGVGRLSMIAVDDRYQRSGAGRQILAYGEDYCRQKWGAKQFSLNVLSSRPALIEWYIRRGFRKTGETEPFPRERFPSLDLPADLCLIEMEKAFGNST